MSVDVSVLIVSYRCRDETLDCLASLPAAAQDVSYEAIVLDNASGDDTVEAVRQGFPEVRVVAEEVNLGFAGGVNRAAAHAAGEYVLLLNPDAVVHPHTIDRIVNFARAHPGHGLYGGRALNPDGSTQPGSCWGKPTLWSLLCFATMLSSRFKGSRFFDPESLGGWQRDSVREVDIVTGCLLLAPTAVWRELGGLDERFFMYGEDTDLALRAARLGYRPIITPDAVITHANGVSSRTLPDKLMLLLLGKTTLLRKHWEGPQLVAGLGLLQVGVGLRAVLSKLASGGAGADAWGPAWRHRRRWLGGYGANGPPTARRAAPSDGPLPTG